MRRLTISGHACAETLALLVAMAWADKKLDENEQRGVREAANVLNLPRELRDRVDALLDAPRPVEELLFEPLSPRERAFAFVAAAWMAGLDEDVHAEERALLEKAQFALGLSDERADELRRIADELPPELRKSENWAQHLPHLLRAIPKHMEHDDGLELEVL